MRKISAPSRVPARILLAATLAASLALAAAPSAWAVLHRLHNGKALSFQPLRGASPPAATFDAALHNLDYNGVPVMPSNTNYAVYWDPSGGSAYPSGYRTGIDTYFEDLAHDSGGRQNTDSVSSQYGDWEGDFARYESHFGGDLLDTDPYPANGCTKATICLTDAQLQTELAKFVEANKLPADLTHEYFLLTPPKVEDCFEPAGAECSAGSKAPSYCAYHSAFNAIAGVVVYANDPYVTGNFGCDDGNHPNGKPSDGALEGGLSHEHNESITDPEPNSGWTDLGANTGEIGDKCRNVGAEKEFGPVLGTTGSGAKYNQVINGHFYWYQQEWSNEGKRCLQRWSPEAAPATATFSSEAAAGANEMKFNAAGSSAPGGVTEYNWKFGATAKPVETTTPTVSHKFPGSGKWEVALTVFAASGESAGTARLVQTGDEGPVVAFSIKDPRPEPGQSVSFEAGGSADPDGSIATYEWNYGDGSPAGSGASAAHAYAAVGDYTVTLRVSDTSGQIATAVHVVEVHGPEVDESPGAEFSFAPGAPTAGAAVAFNASASSDPDGSIASYAWTFGDGAAGAGAAPEHAYGSPGSYPVTLTVTDSAGLKASVTQSVTVLETPPPSASEGPEPSALSGYGAPPGGPLASAALIGFTSTASVNTANGAITLATSVAGSGTFRWRSTFANGTFGVFAARASKCRKGLVRLEGRCRPATIVFSAGSQTASSPGAVKLRLVPTAAARRALLSASARKHGLRVSVTVSFQPAQGGATVTHSYSILVRSRAHR